MAGPNAAAGLGGLPSRLRQPDRHRARHPGRLTAAAALLSMSQTALFLLGSALGGVLAVTPGPWLVYGLDAASLVISFGFLTRLRPLPGAAEHEHATLRGVTAGLRYAAGRRDLLGSYLADLAAMIFAYPNALFPFVAADLHA
ncbi:MAG: MFS transporter, partial [Streptosporangiaceae bacterium]